jgi:hypothetical protein
LKNYLILDFSYKFIKKMLLKFCPLLQRGGGWLKNLTGGLINLWFTLHVTLPPSEQMSETTPGQGQ